MKIIKNITQFREFRNAVSGQNKTVGFVPTMGNLHIGHESLLIKSKQNNQITILSIFVNPTQFNDPKDFETYPNTLEEDLTRAKKLGVDCVFIPNYAELYPDHYAYQLNEQQLSLVLEGAQRPGHFSGMLTIVLKLLNLVKPHRAYLGEKDYQQYALVHNMVEALMLDIEIILCETIREPDGLALSSRNQRLTPEQRKLAPQLYAGLRSKTDDDTLRQQWIQAGFTVEYIETYQGRRFVAATLGNVRLIDNIKSELPTQPLAE